MAEHRHPRALQRAQAPLTGAVVCAMLLVLVGLCALAVEGTRDRDAGALRALLALDRTHTHRALDVAASAVDPLPYVVASLILVAVAAVRGRWALAALLPVLLGGSGATTQVLKHGLATPRLQDFLAGEPIANTAWPSGHSTAAMALALGLVLVVPRTLRPLAAVAGGTLAVCVGISVVALGWHYPSDVLGGFLCAAVWALVVVAALRALDRSPQRAGAPGSAWRMAGALLLLGAAVALATAAGVALLRPDVVSAIARPPAVAAVAAIVVLAAVIPLGTSRVAGS